MAKYSNIVENYFQTVIKKSWTWKKLTEEEQKRFIDMEVFDKIKGNDNTRIEWLNTIYRSFLCALGYKPIGWRETKEENTTVLMMENLKVNPNREVSNGIIKHYLLFKEDLFNG